MKRLSLLFAAFLTGCSGSPEKLVVGSKPFTESEIVGEIIARLAESTGVQVDRKFGMGGMVCFQALKSGDMDVYVEYTGTGLVNILGEPVMTAPDKVLSRVRSEFKKRWDIVWEPPLGFNNSYTLVMRRDSAEKLGISKMSELKGLPTGIRCGFDLEFYDRPDGYRGLVERYGKFCSEITQMAPGLMYTALTGKNVDLISGYSTDGRIASLDLVVLADDLSFFPPYHAAPLTGSKTFQKAPGLRAKLDALEGKLNDEKMIRLNAEVDAKKRPVAVVVEEFLKSEGLL